MMLPVESLVEGYREVGLVVGLLVGFGFGFVLERAGFGRAPKLAAQFYLYDMTVFKVMFGAIVTAMLGVVVAAGLGLVDLVSLSEGAVSATYVWPMLFGGLLLGAGFIMSGYCPGTSLVGTASGNLDALLTAAGVLLGTLLFGELYPVLEGFYLSGDKGQLFLYQVLGVPPEIVAVAIALMAIGAFVGAEKVEKIMTQRIAVAASVVDEERRSASAPRRLAFGLYGVAGLLAVGALFLPVGQSEAARPVEPVRISPSELARRIIDMPWQLKIVDLRAREACAKERVPGAECVPRETLGNLGLQYSPGTRALVLMDESGPSSVPVEAMGYKGDILLLEGGFGAWRQWALETPEPPGPEVSEAERIAYRFRAAVNGALTGRAAPPPPAAPVQQYVPPKPRKGGGCSG